MPRQILAIIFENNHVPLGKQEFLEAKTENDLICNKSHEILNCYKQQSRVALYLKAKLYSCLYYLVQMARYISKNCKFYKL